jgi:16S rRNA (uracil1498-N3)-methyltransferase
MQLFYIPDIKGNTCVMPESESRHCIRVLRMIRGDKINFVDGKGNLYKGIIDDADPSGCGISVSEITRNFEKRNYRLQIGISPIKNQERFEWFVEKSVEIGIDVITPVICRNTEKPGVKHERLNNIIISAMKQSIKAFMPVLNEPVTFSEFVSSERSGRKMIAHCSQAFKRDKIDNVYEKGTDAVILIGPEGDFSDDELTFALDHEYQPVHFGSSRLRTETAGIAACHSIYFINQ